MRRYDQASLDELAAFLKSLLDAGKLSQSDYCEIMTRHRRQAQRMLMREIRAQADRIVRTFEQRHPHNGSTITMSEDQP